MNSSLMDINKLFGIHIPFPIHPSLAISLELVRLSMWMGDGIFRLAGVEFKGKHNEELRERGQEFRRYV
jgi:hypothetical protein